MAQLLFYLFQTWKNFQKRHFYKSKIDFQIQQFRF